MPLPLSPFGKCVYVRVYAHHIHTRTTGHACPYMYLLYSADATSETRVRLVRVENGEALLAARLCITGICNDQPSTGATRTGLLPRCSPNIRFNYFKLINTDDRDFFYHYSVACVRISIYLDLTKREKLVIFLLRLFQIVDKFVQRLRTCLCISFVKQVGRIRSPSLFKFIQRYENEQRMP